MKTYTAGNGVPFNIRVINCGDSYGRDDALTHDDPRPMIEFYDARYPHTEHGQFIARYYLETLIEGPSLRYGLDLQGDVANWKVDTATLEAMLTDALAISWEDVPEGRVEISDKDTFQNRWTLDGFKNTTGA